MTIINFKVNNKAVHNTVRNLEILMSVCDVALQPRNVSLTRNLIPEIVNRAARDMWLVNAVTHLALAKNLLETLHETAESISPNDRLGFEVAVIQLDDPMEPIVKLVIPTVKYTYTLVFGKWQKEYYLMNHFIDSSSMFSIPLPLSTDMDDD